MKRLLPLILVFVVCASTAFAGSALVKIKDLSPVMIKKMADGGYDIGRAGRDFVEVVLNEEQVKSLETLGIPHTIIISDLDRFVARRLAQQKAAPQPYFTYDTVSATLKEWATANPTICRLESIGKSCEGRDIWALKISDNVSKDEKEPASLIMGLHHSREWITVEVPMATAKALIDGYNKDERLTRLVNEREIWFVPIVNPDGLIYSQTKEKFWRKNRRKNANGTFGVDPNRNYGYKWGMVGSSDSASADTYHGTGPFSEPETSAIRDLAKREQFSTDISFHSYGELILYPFSWGYPDEAPNPHKDLFVQFGQEMANFNKYTSQVSSDLYPSMGDTDDFLYGELKSLSFTYELARSFIPAQTEIAKITEANLPAVLHLIEKAGSYGLVTPAGDDLVAELSNTDLLAAARDLPKFAKADDISARLQKVQNQLVLRVLTERQRGESTLLSKIAAEAKDNTFFANIMKLYGQGVTFEQVHSNP